MKLVLILSLLFYAVANKKPKCSTKSQVVKIEKKMNTNFDDIEKKVEMMEDVLTNLTHTVGEILKNQQHLLEKIVNQTGEVPIKMCATSAPTTATPTSTTATTTTSTTKTTSMSTTTVSPGAKLLLHTNGDYNYYRVPVTNGVKLLATNVVSTCQTAGMQAMCHGGNGCGYNSASCMLTPLSTGCGASFYNLATELCGNNDALSCSALEGLFVYLNNWTDDMAYGIVGGNWSPSGHSYTSGTGGNTYFALCVLKQIRLSHDEIVQLNHGENRNSTENILPLDPAGEQNI